MQKKKKELHDELDTREVSFLKNCWSCICGMILIISTEGNENSWSGLYAVQIKREEIK